MYGASPAFAHAVRPRSPHIAAPADRVGKCGSMPRATATPGPPLPTLPAKIHLDHTFVLGDLVDRALRDDRALVKHRHLDAKLAHEGHVVLHHDNGALAVDFP